MPNAIKQQISAEERPGTTKILGAKSISATARAGVQARSTLASPKIEGKGPKQQTNDPSPKKVQSKCSLRRTRRQGKKAVFKASI